VGNFPQAFSHVALVNSAYQLGHDSARDATHADAGAGRVLDEDSSQITPPSVRRVGSRLGRLRRGRSPSS
jgi:hypothetical protein